MEQSKLLGLVLTSDLSWGPNTNYITGRAYSKLWLLRRLKQIGAKTGELIDVYNKQVRSVLEFAVPVWAGSVTLKQSQLIERVQK